MADLTAQNQALATIEIPNLALNNRMSASTRCQKSIHFDELSIADRPVALARTKSSGISTNTLARHTPTKSLKTLPIGPCRARAHFSRETVIVPDFDLGHARATGFSWTSRSQNIKLHTFHSRRYVFHQNRPSELKDMNDFPKF